MASPQARVHRVHRVHWVHWVHWVRQASAALPLCVPDKPLSNVNPDCIGGSPGH